MDEAPLRVADLAHVAHGLRHAELLLVDLGDAAAACPRGVEAAPTRPVCRVARERARLDRRLEGLLIFLVGVVLFGAAGAGFFFTFVVWPPRCES